ncbi:inner membrane protein YgaP [mine drainage metagenome]|uniref:Inner membrane protein YgaP n=1 Tax=mine drainage metagenome TaxID=410659 RepID=A0A1J5T7X9_9ZZZZ
MSEQVNVVDVDTILDWIEQGKAVVVDVREENEWQAHHIAGAHLRPLSSFDAAALPALAPGQKLVLHCRSGVRCGSATAKLLEAGYQGEINRMAGGINAWIAAGYPVE